MQRLPAVVKLHWQLSLENKTNTIKATLDIKAFRPWSKYLNKRLARHLQCVLELVWNWGLELFYVKFTTPIHQINNYIKTADNLSYVLVHFLFGQAGKDLGNIVAGLTWKPPWTFSSLTLSLPSVSLLFFHFSYFPDVQQNLQKQKHNV